MRPIVSLLAGFVVTLVGLIIQRAFKSRRLSPSFAAPSAGPYRTVARSSSVGGAPLILDWSVIYRTSPGGTKEGQAYDCPRCGRPRWLVERYCDCSQCDTGHFHLCCGGSLHQDESAGCMATWIMRSKDTEEEVEPS